MNKLLVAFCLCYSMLVGCNSPDHDAERNAVCAHSEGSHDGQCNAGDSFSPLTCETALGQLEGWWRDEAQTEVNSCMEASACYPEAFGVGGPSIGLPLSVCLSAELYSGLSPTDAEKRLATKVCAKLDACGSPLAATLAECEELLLNPFGEGQLLLFMNDDLADTLADCSSSSCTDYNACLTDALSAAGVFSSVHGARVKVPSGLVK